MDKCFNHKNIQSENVCKYCGKQYCADCLYLQGEIKTVICKNCYEVFCKKFEKSRFRRMSFIVLPLVISAFFIWYIIYKLTAGSDLNNLGFEYFFLILMITMAGVNCVRIRQIKKWKIKEEYKKTEKNI